MQCKILYGMEMNMMAYRTQESNKHTSRSTLEMHDERRVLSIGPCGRDARWFAGLVHLPPTRKCAPSAAAISLCDVRDFAAPFNPLSRRPSLHFLYRFCLVIDLNTLLLSFTTVPDTKITCEKRKRLHHFVAFALIPDTAHLLIACLATGRLNDL